MNIILAKRLDKSRPESISFFDLSSFDHGGIMIRNTDVHVNLIFDSLPAQEQLARLMLARAEGKKEAVHG
jgi:hypothetical protein